MSHVNAYSGPQPTQPQHSEIKVGNKDLSPRVWQIKMNEGTITVSVETWSNMGRGNWRTKRESLSFEDYDSMSEPGSNLEVIISRLRDKIKFSDEGRVAPKT